MDLVTANSSMPTRLSRKSSPKRARLSANESALESSYRSLRCQRFQKRNSVTQIGITAGNMEIITRRPCQFETKASSNSMRLDNSINLLLEFSCIDNASSFVIKVD